MSEPVISRAVLNRLKAPSELAFAERILEMVASAAEPLEIAASLACNMTDTMPETASTSAREAFLAAAAMSAPRAKYAQASHELARSLPVCVNKKAAVAARTLRDLRCEFKRFSDLHVDGRLLPLSVFIAALELPPFEQLQRRKFHFTPELVRLRNEMIKEYLRIKQAIVLQPRCASEGPIKCNALGLTDGGSNNGLSNRRSSLVTRWEAFERRWLQEKDGHAVIALQPLVGAVSAAQAVLQSCKKQLVLPEPSASMQRVCTYRALQAFCSSISTLARELLPVESSCLFLEASTVILAASIAEEAARSAAERALERRSPQVDSNSLLQSQSVERPGWQRGSNTATGKHGSLLASDVCADLHLASLSGVARVSEEDIVVYSVKRQPLAAARALVSHFLELLRQVWQARLCLTHISPILHSSCPELVEALNNFDRAHASFQLPRPILPHQAPESPCPSDFPTSDHGTAQRVLG